MVPGTKSEYKVPDMFGRHRIGTVCLCLTALAALRAATAAPIPEYRAVYRIDYNGEVATGTEEVALSYDSAAGQYTFTVKDTVVKFPKRDRVLVMTFDLVNDGVRPSYLRWETGNCASCTQLYQFNWASGAVDLRSGGYRTVFRIGRAKGLVMSLAAVVALLPGRHELARLKGLLCKDSGDPVELATAVGVVHAQRRELRGGKEYSASDGDLWLARELGALPVRIESRAPGRKSETIEVTELQGIVTPADRGVAETPN
ncbi:MAG TPA: hypothetical protein VL131_12805 [Gammaproteobacteria bacterium]|nr:hypothetical protein [Gammaproteobacteria bacterium]